MVSTVDNLRLKSERGNDKHAVLQRYYWFRGSHGRDTNRLLGGSVSRSNWTHDTFGSDRDLRDTRYFDRALASILDDPVRFLRGSVV